MPRREQYMYVILLYIILGKFIINYYNLLKKFNMLIVKNYFILNKCKKFITKFFYFNKKIKC